MAKLKRVSVSKDMLSDQEFEEAKQKALAGG